MIVVDKQAGLVVHPGAGHRSGTLVHGLVARYPELAALPAEVGSEPDRPGIVHRLDRGTSGLMVVARTPAAYHSLVGQLSARAVSRTYRALVLGHVEGESGLVDAPIGRSVSSPTRMAISRKGKEARPATRWSDGSPRRPRPPWCGPRWRPAGPIRSGCTWRPSGTRWWGTSPTARAGRCRGHRHPPVPARLCAGLRPPDDGGAAVVDVRTARRPGGAAGGPGGVGGAGSPR